MGNKALDKAHLFNTRDINAIMVLADKIGAKVIFNTKASLGKLSNQLGGCNILLESGMEQIGDKHLKSLEVKINSLVADNRIKVIQDTVKQVDLIKTFCASIARAPRVVVPTVSLKTSLNEDIRSSLVASGRIAAKAIEADVLQKTSMSDMDRRLIQFYQIGYVVRGDGQYYEVLHIDRASNSIQLVNLNTREYKNWDFSKKAFQTVDVYQHQKLVIAKGDVLEWTRTITINDEKRRRNVLIHVLNVSNKDAIVVRDNLGKEFVINPNNMQERHFNYSYAKTIQESMHKDARIDILYCHIHKSGQLH